MMYRLRHLVMGVGASVRIHPSAMSLLSSPPLSYPIEDCSSFVFGSADDDVGMAVSFAS